MGSIWAIISGVIALALVVFGVYNACRRRRIKHILVAFLSKGQQISELLSVNWPDEETEMKQWTTEVREYIKSHCSKDEEIMFVGSEGLKSHWEEKGQVNYSPLAQLDIKLQRLRELIRRL
jgi:hypothetical protein